MHLKNREEKRDAPVNILDSPFVINCETCVYSIIQIHSMNLEACGKRAQYRIVFFARVNPEKQSLRRRGFQVRGDMEDDNSRHYEVNAKFLMS